MRLTLHFRGVNESHLVYRPVNEEHTSAITDHIKATGHNIKWDHSEILASGKTDYHCKIKETLFIQELNPTLNTDLFLVIPKSLAISVVFK